MKLPAKRIAKGHECCVYKKLIHSDVYMNIWNCFIWHTTFHCIFYLNSGNTFCYSAGKGDFQSANVLYAHHSTCYKIITHYLIIRNIFWTSKENYSRHLATPANFYFNRQIPSNSKSILTLLSILIATV